MRNHKLGITVFLLDGVDAMLGDEAIAHTQYDMKEGGRNRRHEVDADGSKERKTLFVVFSSTYQELTFATNGLLRALMSSYEVILIVPSETAKVRLTSHPEYSTATVVVKKFSASSCANRVIDALLSFKYERFSGPFRRQRRDSARARLSRFRRTRISAHCLLAHLVPEILLVSIQYRLLSDTALDALYRQHRPILTLLSWGSAYEPCRTVVRSARKFRAKTISVDATWDCMDECIVVPKVDRLLVWNELMKNEAVERHRYDPDQVSVVGPLRCDYYRQEERFVPRDEYFGRHRLDTKRRLVTLVVNRGNPEIYCRIVSAVLNADSLLSCPIHICVRLAPWSEAASYQSIANHPHVTVLRGYDLDRVAMIRDEEIAETVNLLRHTDVLITVLSTFILESAYFGTPNISLRFQEFRELYERDFIGPLYETKGVVFVDDLFELIKALNRYLLDPTADSKGRGLILQRLCHGGDGMVKHRVLSEIEGLIAGSHPRSRDLRVRPEA